MTTTPSHESREAAKQREAEVREGLDRMKRVIASVAKGRLDEDEIQSLAHDCWVRFVHAKQRTTSWSPAGLQVNIAWKWTVKKLAKRKRWQGRIVPNDSPDADEDLAPRETPDIAPGPEHDFDLADTLGFFIQAILGFSKENCRERFSALLQFHYSRHVAAEFLGEPYNTFVVGLNRCIKVARQILEADDGPLGQAWREHWGRP